MRVLAALVLGVLGLWPSFAAAQTIKLGAVVPLTGRYGAGGAQVRSGYEIAVEQINAAGGVTVAGKKMPLELILLDDESDATKTVARLESLASQGVVAYLGGFGSDLHAAAASVAEKNKIPYLGVAFALNKVHQQGFKYLFSPFWKSPDIGQATQGLLGLIPAGERPKTVVIFQEKTDWGKEMATAWTEAGRAAGYTATVGEYSPGAKDCSDLIRKAKAANADAVFALPTPPDGMTIVKQMKELGYTPKLALFIRAPDAIVWSKNLGKDGDWMVLAAGWHHAAKAPGVKELNDAHEKKYGRATDPISGPSYACVQIAAAAVAKAGSLDHAKVRDAIAATDMTTVIGPVKFRPDGTGIVQQAFLQWQNGKQELVWPKEFATAPLAYPAPPFAGLTVLETVLVGRLYGRARTTTSEAVTEARRLLRVLGLEPRAGEPAARLTLIDRKRLELARALATSPRLLLLDEFMAGLNPVETATAMELVRDLVAGGMTVLMVEHIVWALMDLARRIIVLSAGEKIADGPPAAVAADPNVVDVYLGAAVERRTRA